MKVIHGYLSSLGYQKCSKLGKNPVMSEEIEQVTCNHCLKKVFHGNVPKGKGNNRGQRMTSNILCEIYWISLKKFIPWNDPSILKVVLKSLHGVNILRYSKKPSDVEFYWREFLEETYPTSIRVGEPILKVVMRFQSYMLLRNIHNA